MLYYISSNKSYYAELPDLSRIHLSLGKERSRLLLLGLINATRHLPEPVRRHRLGRWNRPHIGSRPLHGRASVARLRHQQNEEHIKDTNSKNERREKKKKEKNIQQPVFAGRHRPNY